MLRRKISPDIQHYIREKADHLCEYCHTSELWQYVRFTTDHIIPLSQGGTDDIDNLCLACFHCNRRKSNKIKGIDPVSETESPLFDPRKELWNDHFIWSEDKLHIIGLTPTGRATVETLDMNRERIVMIRAADVSVNRHPPKNDRFRR